MRPERGKITSTRYTPQNRWPEVFTMTLRISCPHCSSRLTAQERLAGLRISCPKCGKKVLVPKPDDELDEDGDPEATVDQRKLVYVQKEEKASVDAAGAISLVLGILALVCLVMGYFTRGYAYFAAVPVALIGFGLAFLGKGSLRIADWALNFLVLLPAAVVLALHLAGVQVTQKIPSVEKPVVAAKPAETDDGGPVAPLEDIKWIDASKGQPVVHGNVKVLIDKVRIDMPASNEIDKLVESVAGSSGKQVSLLIEVMVGNPSETKKLEFRPWSKSLVGDSTRLTDNFKNSYKARGPEGLSALSGVQQGVESINPNTTVTDTLSFELPVDKMKYLHLELPTENFGGKGKIYFEIPRSMIKQVRK